MKVGGSLQRQMWLATLPGTRKVLPQRRQRNSRRMRTSYGHAGPFKETDFLAA
ncbi:MAG: hypothetical protein ACK6D0_05780 [Planctomyces sp.]